MLGYLSGRGGASDMLDWIAKITEKRTAIILLMAAALMYVIGLGTFFAYRWQAKQVMSSRAQTIAECLSSRGHVGPGDTCRYDKPLSGLEAPI
jgi:hypothetical protein